MGELQEEDSMTNEYKIPGTLEHFENNQTWFNQGGFFPSFAIPNALSDNECKFLESEIFLKHTNLVNFTYDWNDDRIPQGTKVSDQYFWNWGELPDAEQLINDKVFVHVPEKIPFGVTACSLVYAYHAYGIHSDYLWGVDRNRKIPHRTIIIPLETIDTQTVVLNQYGPYLHFIEYKKDHGPLPNDRQISTEDFDKYLSHCWPHEKEHISIKDVLSHTQGAALSFDRQFFHSGSNFRSKNITIKKFVVIWTYLE